MDHPTVLRHLWAFQIAAEEQQFQLAAERLHIAQSAVSRRIKHLEQQLGVTLFERRSNGAKLTREGEIFRDDVVQVLRRIDEAVARVRRARQGEVGTLRVGYIEMAMRHTVLPRAVKLFHQRFPEVELTLTPMPSGEVDQAVRLRSVDVGLFHRNEERSDELEYRHIATHKLLLALPKSSPHAGKRSVRLAGLNGETFILPSRASAPQIHDRVVTALRMAGTSPRIIMESGASETMLHMVSAGLGLGFVDSSRAGSAPDNVLLRSMMDFSESMVLEMAWQRSNQSPVLKHFVAALLPLLGKS